MDDCADASICINKYRLPSRVQARRQLGKSYGSLHYGSVTEVHSFNSYTSKFKETDLQATATERKFSVMKHCPNSWLQHVSTCTITLKMGVID